MSSQVRILRSNAQPEDGTVGNPLDYLSASRLKSFLTCRLRFYYEKVLGLKTPSTPNLHIGKAVHAGLEAFHVARWREEDGSTPLIIEAYHSAYRALEEEDPVDYGEKEREECLATGERVVRAYLDSELAADPRRVLGVEVYLRAEDPSMPLPLLGVLDLVREGNVPVDFKTIGSTPNLEEEAWANQLQLSMYHLLLRDATDEEPGAGELVYLVKLKTPKVIQHRLPPVEDVQLSRLRSLADIYVDGVKRGDFYPSPGMHCRWCEFRGRCRAWTALPNTA
ncbi:MAG: PD-(D/E)XK nuclease family protein [Opitutales bacterium]